MQAPPATALAAARPMPGWVKAGLLAALVVGACWGGAIWYWRANNIDPASGEVVLFLLAAPVALLLGLGISRKLIALRAAAPAVATQAKPVQAASTPQPGRPLAIVAASVRSPHGASVDELAAAIADNKARADLDEELVDEDGFPLMTARSSDAQDPALREEISEWLTHNGMSELRFSDEQWRALTMASGVAEDLASHAASNLIPAAGAPPVLQLIPVLPAGWNIEQRRAAGMWFKHTVAQFGWPPAHIPVVADMSDAHGTPLSAVLTQLAREAGADNAHLAAMVVACASHIGEETVARWAASETLFTSSRPQGLIPGEGAAGLLITSLHDGMAVENMALVLIDPAGGEQGDSSAVDNGRADPKLLGELAERALRFGAIESSKVGMVVADTGHRANRVLELMGCVSGTMPQLDGTADVANVGVATGTCGTVPLLTALALARHHALERSAPVLCIGNADPLHRCAILIRPAAVLSLNA